LFEYNCFLTISVLTG